MKKIKRMALLGLIFMLLFATNVYADTLDKINVPEGYVTPETKITVTTSENEDKVLKSITVKSGDLSGDITKSKFFYVSGACEVEVTITYEDKDKKFEVNTLKAKIENYDGVKPELSASILGNELLIKAEDDLSGVSLINVNGTDHMEAEVKVNVKELEQTNDYINVYAKDKAGNTSGTYKIKNPYYVGEVENRQDQSTDNPQSTEPSAPTEAKATITSHTDDEGRDLSSSADDTEPIVKQPDAKKADSVEIATVSNKKAGGKEFYTIKTDSDKVFYLVVDETNTNENAYLLTEVGENDLLNFVNYDGNKVESGELTVYSIKEDTGKLAEEPKEEVEEESKEETKEETKKSPIGMIIIVIFVGVIAYIVKFKKNKSDTSDDDFDEDDAGDDDFMFEPDGEIEE